MNKYMVTGLITISVHTIVEAEDAEQAKEVALGREPGSVHPSSACAQYDEWVAEDLDGEVKEDSLEVSEVGGDR